MRPSYAASRWAAAVVSLSSLLPLASAIRIITSSSLNSCQANSGFTASLFNVKFTPDNRTLEFDIIGSSTIRGNVTVEFELIAYGYTALKEKLDPCTTGLTGLCPMNAGQINLPGNIVVPEDFIGRVPGIAYTIPDLDGKVRVRVLQRLNAANQLACVEAELSNGKTVYQKGVGWASAVIAGLALLASAITSGLGHSNTAAHVAANAMSLFGFFQAQALFGMTSVSLPPIVASWTQNFQWSMGIIRVGFLQDICTWYQRSTGGTPSNVLGELSTTSVAVQKRSVEVLQKVFPRTFNEMTRRSNNDPTAAETLKTIVVRGIERVGFRARIELTNIFLTGYSFFVIFVVFVVILVLAFKGILALLARSGRMKSDKFQDFRNGWKTVLKGILFRLVLIGFPQMCVLCFWELTRRDSAAEVVLAVFTIFTMLFILTWACSKVILLARRSIAMHKTPGYILYSDPVSLNKWGFLYVQFKAAAYYFIVPILLYILAKGMFVGLGQGSGVTQAIAFVIIEAALLIGVSIMRPYMDKKTNAFNISICAVNLVSSIFLLIFTEIFGQPGLVSGVLGVVFFIMNAAFALALLLMVLISSIYAIVSKNPDTRYQPMRDDRGSFIKSQTQLTTELDALGATARGDMKMPYKNRDFDSDSLSSASLERQNQQAKHDGTVDRMPLSYISYRPTSYSDTPPRSPVNRLPMFQDNRTTSPVPYNNTYYPPRSNTTSPVGTGGPLNLDNQRIRAQNNASPWQRGAGYDH